MESYVCNNCDDEKPLSECHANRNNANGHNHTCKKCQVVLQRRRGAKEAGRPDGTNRCRNCGDLFFGSNPHKQLCPDCKAISLEDSRDNDMIYRDNNRGPIECQKAIYTTAQNYYKKVLAICKEKGLDIDSDDDDDAIELAVAHLDKEMLWR